VELLKKKAAEVEVPDIDDGPQPGQPVNGVAVDYGETFKASYKLNILPSEAAYSLFIDS
jgi:hypothetical protein